MRFLFVPVSECWRLVFRSTFTLYICRDFRVIYYALYKDGSDKFYFITLDREKGGYIGFEKLDYLLEYLEGIKVE